MQAVQGRVFSGKVSGFTDKNDRLFNQRWLRAYLKGQEVFSSGYVEVSGVKEKDYFRVEDGENIPHYHRVVELFGGFNGRKVN